jgi:CheY-like chemotaxis protein
MTGDRKKIIVVDDSLDDLTAIKNTLKDLYEVYPCPSASKMFDLLEHINPDLILLDVEMPDVNGYETARKLKNETQYREIPVIFLTAMIDVLSEMEGLKLYAVDYIHKPFATPLLLQRIKTHLALIEHQIEARNASRAKSEFLALMTQEIHAPLNAIIGMINIASNTGDTQKIKYCLEQAGNASKDLLNIINNILGLSKIEENIFELSYNEFNVKKMLQDIINVTNIRVKEKNINFNFNLDNNIPSSIISDELKLTQIIMNLINNAIKFTPEHGTVTLNVEMAEETDDEITIRTEVADGGAAITEEQRKRLFTSYNQADISKKTGDTELGLAISKLIAELMRGTIWLESEINKGSKFIFTIKAKKTADTAVTEIPGNQDESDESGFNFANYTILVVDDVEINRELLAALLERTGIIVDFAENGKAAVSMFQEHPRKYNLILMDVHMPEMGGYEATRVIRSSDGDFCKQIPIIAMTFDVFPEDIEDCLSSGMNDHIGKPIASENLYKTLKKYLVPL